MRPPSSSGCRPRSDCPPSPCSLSYSPATLHRSNRQSSRPVSAAPGIPTLKLHLLLVCESFVGSFGNSPASRRRRALMNFAKSARISRKPVG